MMCHSVEAARFLLTKPGESRESLTPIKVSANIASLKWTRANYIEELKQTMGVDYSKEPSEDYAHASITFKDKEQNTLIAELTTSWSFVGPGLRLRYNDFCRVFQAKDSSRFPVVFCLNLLLENTLQNKRNFIIY